MVSEIKRTFLFHGTHPGQLAEFLFLSAVLTPEGKVTLLIVPHLFVEQVL